MRVSIVFKSAKSRERCRQRFGGKSTPRPSCKNFDMFWYRFKKW